jgi:hypothetical protein
MSFNIFQQVGHNSNWNIDSMSIDGAADGLILSPVHQKKSAVEAMDPELRRISIFDPQYYLPNSQKKKLQTYDFFPEVMAQGFNTVDFSQLAHDSARECLEFQISQEFGRIVIPTRFFREMITDYKQRQEAYSVNPFIDQLRGRQGLAPILLTLPLTSSMVLDEGFRTQILNWVTSYQQIHGVYIFIVDDRETKQPADADQLLANLNFFQELRSADLEVIVGYCNTEALLYTAVDDCSVSMGSFENTRMFSIEKFMTSDESRRGPKARIYLPGLLNWVLFSEANDIRARFPDIWKDIYISTDYADDVLSSPVEPTFNQPGLYKHHFITIYRQADFFRSISDIAKRRGALNESIQAALSNYQRIEDAGISLNTHSLGGHLNSWSLALSRFS